MTMITFEHYKKEYFDLVYKWHTDLELSEKIGFEKIPTKDETSDLIQAWLEDTKRKWFFLNYEDEIIGYVVLSDINEQYSNAILHTLVGEKKYIGTKTAVEVGDTILDYAFNKLNLHRIVTYIMANNPQLIETALKYGFIKEGILKDAIKFKDNYLDIHLFRMLKTEFMPKLEGELICQ